MPPYVADTPERGPSSYKEKVQHGWNWMIGYDTMEANRLGVPIVSSKDWVKDLFRNPGDRVSKGQLWWSKGMETHARREI